MIVLQRSMLQSAEDHGEAAAREEEEDAAARAEAGALLQQLPSGCREAERLLALCRLLSQAHLICFLHSTSKT